MTKRRPSRFLPTEGGTPDDQERRIAKRFGGKKVAGSGSSDYSKGDVRDVTAGSGDEIEFLVECKQTLHASLSVKWAWLTKITREASAVQKEPALAIEIQGGKNDPLCDRDWVLISARSFERLTKS
jgi:Holliday junction resolvase